MKLNFKGKKIKHDKNRRYFEVILDRILTYRSHLESIQRKRKYRLNIVQHCFEVDWLICVAVQPTEKEWLNMLSNIVQQILYLNDLLEGNAKKFRWTLSCQSTKTWFRHQQTWDHDHPSGFSSDLQTTSWAI